MSKINLYGDTVLRKDGVDLYLMNRQIGGWSQKAIPVGGKEEFLSKYNVQIGEWSRDEHGEFCPVYRLPTEEQCFSGGVISDGLQQFIDAHPGVRVGQGTGRFLVALLPDGTVYSLDKDGTVVSSEEES